MDITQDGFEEENVEQVDNFKYPDNFSDIKGYHHLHFLCKNVRNESPAIGNESPITPRLQYIIEALSTQGISFKLDILNSDNAQKIVSPNDRKLANVVVFFEGNNKELPTVVFTSHHDIANKNSENCQDNTASVCNLLHLASVVKQKHDEGLLEQSVLIGFTDCEEIGGRGIDKLNIEIQSGKYGNLECIYALELTACGTEFWVSGSQKGSTESDKLQTAIGDKELNFVRTPYNESVNSRREGMTACCIGILPVSEIEVVKQRGYCSTWALCHNMEDTFERSANEEEMDNFVNVLTKLITFKNQ